jgi:hypothetical protein
VAIGIKHYIFISFKICPIAGWILLMISRKRLNITIEASKRVGGRNVKRD